MLPNRDLEGRWWRWLHWSAGFIGAFNGFATYPVTIPGWSILVRRRASNDKLPRLFFLDAALQQPAHRAQYFLRGEPRTDRGYCSSLGTAHDPACFSFLARLFETFGLPFLCLEVAGPILDNRTCQRRCHRTFYAGVAFVLYSDDDRRSRDVPGRIYSYGRVAKRRSATKSEDAAEARPSYSTLGLFKAYAPLLRE